MTSLLLLVRQQQPQRNTRARRTSRPKPRPDGPLFLARTCCLTRQSPSSPAPFAPPLEVRGLETAFLNRVPESYRLEGPPQPPSSWDRSAARRRLRLMSRGSPVHILSALVRWVRLSMHFRAVHCASRLTDGSAWHAAYTGRQPIGARN